MEGQRELPVARPAGALVMLFDALFPVSTAVPATIPAAAALLGTALPSADPDRGRRPGPS